MELLQPSGSQVSSSHKLSSQEHFRTMPESMSLLLMNLTLSLRFMTKSLMNKSQKSQKTDASFMVNIKYCLIPNFIGMYLEGARWNNTTHMLDDSKPKQLYTELPMCWFLPKKNRKRPETVLI